MVSHPLRRPLALSSSPLACHVKSEMAFEVSDERVRWSMVDMPFAFPPSLLLPRLYSALQARGLHCSIRLCLPPSLHPCVTHARTVRNSMGAWNTCAGWTNAPPALKRRGRPFLIAILGRKAQSLPNHGGLRRNSWRYEKVRAGWEACSPAELNLRLTRS